MRVGAVDIGSNALRAVVVEGKAGKARYEVVEDRREAVRLGTEVFGGSGYVSRAVATAAAGAMRSFARDFRRLGVDRVRVVATSALREARNRRSLLKLLSRESGLAVEVITGAEEARLVSLAVRSRIPALAEGRHVVMDVGGGSAEAIVVEDGEVAGAASFDVGAVRLIQQVGEPHGPAFLRVASRFLENHRASIREALGPGPFGVFAATGGNIETVAGLIGRKRGGRPPIHAVDREDLEDLVAAMADLTPPQRMRRWSLRADRADVVLPACLVYLAFARLAGARRILVPHVGLRESVALDLLLAGKERPARERLGRERVASAAALGRKYHYDEGHARQVARLALRIFDRVGAAEGLDREDRDLLEIASLLHDIGVVVSPIRHHRHSAYLIRESELAGLSPEGQEIVAQVARYHRRGMPRASHAEHAALSARDRRRVCLLAGILRLADALDRDRSRPLEDLDVRRRGGVIAIRLLGSGDRLLEVWAGERKKDLLERSLGREVVLRKG
jgi:exopolyphosphatase/guanosine-5'-triphosphate,3'-diphosphate pyrophosphatase